jgi:hypothetical protein
MGGLLTRARSGLMNRDRLPGVSVIIVNYNGAEYLPDCLDSLAGLDYPAGRYEVVVVDNASTDGSLELLTDKYPWARVISNQTNLGFAGGNNAGMRQVESEFVALLNNDTVVDRRWLAELVDAALSDDAIGITTSKILFRDRPAVINNAGSLVLPNGWGADRGFNQEDKGQFDEVEEVFSACGASMLLRKRMLDDIGLFDGSFFCYYEDSDLSWRARLMGWKIVYNPRSFLYHVHSGTSVEWSPFFTFHVLRNRHFMLLKNAWWGLFFKSFKDFLKHTIVDSGIRGKNRRRTSRNRNYFRLDIRLRVLGSLIRRLPSLLAKRRRIRSGMKIDETYIKKWITTGRRPVG